MNKVFSKIWIIVAVLIMVGVGILAWQQGWVASQDEEEGGWKTYTSRKYGFEIKYPSELTRKESSQSDASKVWQFIKGEKSVAELSVRNFDRVNEEWCQNAGGSFQSFIEFAGETHLKCLHPESGKQIVSQYSISLGQKKDAFFDFNCDDLFYESQICDKVLSSFQFLK